MQFLITAKVHRPRSNALARFALMQFLITAKAHKLARILYYLLKTGTPYDDTVFARNEVLYQQRHTAHLRKQARELGFTLTPLTAQGEVSYKKPSRISDITR